MTATVGKITNDALGAHLDPARRARYAARRDDPATALAYRLHQAAHADLTWAFAHQVAASALHPDIGATGLAVITAADLFRTAIDGMEERDVDEWTDLVWGDEDLRAAS